VLLRAFGPVRRAWNEPLDLGEVCRLAELFDLIPRIAGRLGREALRRETGEECAEKWLLAYRLTAASNLQFLAFAGKLAGLAKGLGIPIAFVKGTALGLAAVVPLGWRAACDIDLLVPPDRLEELRSALVGEGFVSSKEPGCEHQMPPLHHPSGLMVELHRHIPGLRLSRGRSSATFGDLERLGLLEQGSRVPAGSYLPVKKVLVAHCLVHGLVQHGPAPGSYPAFRAVTDLMDLGFGDDAEPLPATFQLDRLDGEAVETTREVVRQLMEGVTEGLVVGETPQSRLLRHLIAGATDERYREALKASPFSLGGFSDKSAPLAFLSSLSHALFITRPEVDAIYGRQKSSAGYLYRQIMRPVDIASRAVRYSIQALRAGRMHRLTSRSKP
jgi:hypothetical protein